jgi:hypothetical protein
MVSSLCGIIRRTLIHELSRYCLQAITPERQIVIPTLLTSFEGHIGKGPPHTDAPSLFDALQGRFKATDGTLLKLSGRSGMLPVQEPSTTGFHVVTPLLATVTQTSHRPYPHIDNWGYSTATILTRNLWFSAVGGNRTAS